MKKYLLIVLLLLVTNPSCAKNIISNYHRTFVPVYTPEGKLMLAIRVFKMNGVPSFLTVDVDSLKTQVIPIAELKARNTLSNNEPGYFTFGHISSTRYYQLLNKNTAAPYRMHNQGVKHARKGHVLTVDLCPSNKPFEAEFFAKLVHLSEKTGKPTPITIAITGMWLIKHADEFQWLLTQEKEHKLEITWANHSFSHVYYHDLPFSENFLRTPMTEIEGEILLTEQYLLEAGEIPSVFFRFPGLVSSKSLVKTIKKYGLIPLGTDAWMANLTERHEQITPGGIILVHGNGNEHQGIVVLFPLLDELNLLDIRDVI